MTFYLMTFTLKYEHVSAVKGAPDRSSENTPIFEAEIKGKRVHKTLVSAKEFTKQFNKRYT